MTGIQIAYAQDELLHPLAQRSVFAERLHPLIDEQDKSAIRSPFARDRDRIIFSKSFRRLSHKTQLYISNEGNEHNRTRLTHTIEVAQIAKTIAWNLSMNIELVEAIAYGHDVGHSPFGHAGEGQINRFLKGMEPLPRHLKDRFQTDAKQEEDTSGDFRHNYQSIRILTFLEKHHPDYEGMNLTFQCLEGILKHTKITPLVDTGKAFNFPGIKDEEGIFYHLDKDKPYSVTIEGQIVSIVDEIAQVIHDINDALRIGALSHEKLLTPLIRNVIEKDKMRYPASIIDCRDAKSKQQTQATSAFINYFTRYIIELFKKKIDKIKKKSVKKPFKANRWLLANNIIKDKAFQELEKIRDDTVLNNYTVNRMDNKGEYFIRNLFEAYLNNPRQLPDAMLQNYCETKRREIKRLGKKGFADWLIKKKEQYKITGHLPESQLKEIISFLKNKSDGHDFRLLSHQIIDNMRPYLAIDSDFIRVVSDHIASMTDKYAKEEYGRLYL
ncbi:dNTP triphosphohydrolase [Deltaproteobacteria bacterium]|nr:dNTP triphosphohydrolase [Deltaproteobacteria bacterium]